MSANNVKNRLREYLVAKGREITHNDRTNCPFHDDKTPSCKVNDDFVHCFSCNESGDIYKVAAALIDVPCDKEHFREIANEVERTLGIPEWKPPKRQGKNNIKLSRSTIFKFELLNDFAAAIDAEDLERAFNRAHLLLGLFMLPDVSLGKKKPFIQDKIAAYGIRGRHE